MAEKKVFMNNQNIATFVCEKCDRARTVDVSKYKDIKQAVKMKYKCPCGAVTPVLLERRRYFRKETHLPGVLISSRGDMGGIIVKDLSRTGVKFEIKVAHQLRPGEVVTLKFDLDDKHQSTINKDARIKTMKGKIIGAEFTLVDPSSASDKAIGFYLF